MNSLPTEPATARAAAPVARPLSLGNSIRRLGWSGARLGEGGKPPLLDLLTRPPGSLERAMGLLLKAHLVAAAATATPATPAADGGGRRGAALSHRLTPWLAPLLSVVLLVVLGHSLDLFTLAKKIVALPPNTYPANLPLNWWLIVPAAAAAGMVIRQLQGRPAAQAGVAVGALAVLPLLAQAAPALLWPVWLAVVAHLVWRALAFERTTNPDRARWSLAHAAMLGVLAAGTSARLPYYLFGLKNTLQPDVINFLLIAERSVGFATDTREPLYIWLMQLAKWISNTEYTPPFVRTFSLACGLAATTGACYATFARFGLVATVPLAFLVSGYNLPILPSGWQPAEGLREELITGAWMVFIAVYTLGWSRAMTWRRALTIALGATLSLSFRLTTLNTLLALLATLYGWEAVKLLLPALAARLMPLAPSGQGEGENEAVGRRLKRLLLQGAVTLPIMLVLLAPWMVHCKAKFGDPLYAINFAYRFYVNTEYVSNEPGRDQKWPMPTKKLPTIPEVQANGYAGPRVTAGEYLFDYHTPGQLAEGMYRGAKFSYFGLRTRPVLKVPETGQLTPSATLWPPSNYRFYLWMLVFSALVWLLPGARAAGWAFLLFQAPAFYLTQFIWFDPRLMYNMYAGHMLGVGIGLSLLLAGAAQVLAQTQEPARRPVAGAPGAVGSRASRTGRPRPKGTRPA